MGPAQPRTAGAARRSVSTRTAVQFRRRRPRSPFDIQPQASALLLICNSMWSADETNEPLGSLLAHWSLAAASLQGEVGSDNDQKADDRPADILQHSSREYGLDGDYSGNQVGPGPSGVSTT
eukprot:5863617-Pleurochrysis_carterae.AAC.4